MTLRIFTGEVPERGVVIVGAHSLIPREQHLAGTAIDILTDRAGSNPPRPVAGWMVRAVAHDVSPHDVETVLGNIGDLEDLGEIHEQAICDVLGKTAMIKVFEESAE